MISHTLINTSGLINPAAVKAAVIPECCIVLRRVSYFILKLWVGKSLHLVASTQFAAGVISAALLACDGFQS